MKRYKIFFNPSSQKLSIINFPSNAPLSNLNPPITVSREEELIDDQKNFSNKKSEVIYHKEQELKKLFEQESTDPVITDKDNKKFNGRLQYNDNNHFLLIYNEDKFVMDKIDNWYRFSLYMPPTENKKIEEEDLMTSSETVEEIPREREVEEKDHEDFNIFKEEERRKMMQQERRMKRKNEKNKLTNQYLKDICGDDAFTIKEVIQKVKNRYNVGKEEKEIIQKFLKEDCVGTKINGMKKLKVKKN